MTESLLEFDALLAAMIDQTITPAQRETMEQMMRDDASLRRLFIEHMVLDADMHWDHHREVRSPVESTVARSSFRVRSYIAAIAAARTGLGLSVSYFIINETHKGTIQVESQEGAGARFTIHLPLKT